MLMKNPEDNLKNIIQSTLKTDDLLNNPLKANLEGLSSENAISKNKTSLNQNIFQNQQDKHLGKKTFIDTKGKNKQVLKGNSNSKKQK